MPFWRQKLREEISLIQVIPDQGLIPPTPIPDPASDATSWDTGQRHSQTHGPPQKGTQPMVNGGHWKMNCPVNLVPLGRSPLLL